MTAASIAIALHSRADTASGQQFVHLLPAAGDIHGRDGRVFRLTDAMTVIQSSRKAAGRVKMPIDYEHATDLAAPKGGAAPAAGWITGLQAATDGIWGLVEWTPRAAQHIAQREYRYISPTFTHTKDGEIIAILRAALTNTPNLDQLTALASMETNMDQMAELRKLLGLGEDATLDDVLANVRELSTATHSATTPDPAKFVPIGDFERVVSEVNKLNQGISLQAATAHVEDKIRAGLLPPYLKTWAVGLCSVNKPKFDEFVQGTSPALAHLFTEGLSGAVSQDGIRHSGVRDEEIAIASNLGITTDALLKTRAARGAQE